jgi:hypothetical protein
VGELLKFDGSGGGMGDSNADDDDLEITHIEGDLALVDFPHAREHCVAFKFGSQQFCQRCFCIVCDRPAAACTKWPEHCTVSWKQASAMREKERKIAEALLQPTLQELKALFDAVVAEPGLKLEAVTLRLLVGKVEQRHGMAAGMLSKDNKKLLKDWALEVIEDNMSLL